tara:strand:- start:4577 stop:5440 length:864 start_codon:yes stop_codon:yes gene_type:complete
MKINKDTTFLILHKGRHEVTKNTLKYLVKFYPNENYIFADGDNDNVLEEYITQLGFKNLEYFHSPDLSIKDYFKKELKAVDLVKTKYAMLVDTDDFIIPSGILELENFLNDNKFYISCGFPIPGIEVTKNKINFYKKFTPAHWIDSPHEKDQKERIKKLGKFYVSHYDLYRVEVLKEMIETLIECDLESIIMYEFSLAFSALCIGPQMRLREGIHYIRQYETSLEDNFVRGTFGLFFVPCIANLITELKASMSFIDSPDAIIYELLLTLFILFVAFIKAAATSSMWT